ncbi:MAG: hypothetical protein IT204_25245 [Fimbriimonadaceae bacterium]|nr:hypothetical protein [Fimbriimonadaceae bacterium]
MNSVIVPLLLILGGVTPGFVAAIAAIVLWRQRRVLEEHQVRRSLWCGYGWLAVFCFVAVFATQDSSAKPWLIAFGWIATPALFSVFGLWYLAERQRLLQGFPSPQRMFQLSTENRQELRYLASELSSDLNRALAAQTALAKGNAVLRRMGRDTDETERVVQRLRASIQRCHELEARYGLHLRRVKVLLDDEAYDNPELTEEQEVALANLQDAQNELDALLSKLFDSAVDCRAAVNRAVQDVAFTGVEV